MQRRYAIWMSLLVVLFGSIASAQIIDVPPVSEDMPTPIRVTIPPTPIVISFPATATPTPTITPTLPATSTPFVPTCVAVIGDSSANGALVSEVPGYGFPVVQTLPFSRYLQIQFGDFTQVRNYSVGAVGLANGSAGSYYNTAAYARLQETPCTTAVLFPWLNDLPNPDVIDVATGVAQHAANVDDFTRELLTNTPVQHLIMLSYYNMPQTALGQRVYGGSIAPQVISSMNRTLLPVCTDLRIAFPQKRVSCVDISQQLGTTNEIIALSISRETFTNNAYRALNPDEAGFFIEFWEQFPDSPIRADGAHLNGRGKIRLATLIMNLIRP